MNRTEAERGIFMNNTTSFFEGNRYRTRAKVKLKNLNIKIQIRLLIGNNKEIIIVMLI
jgi:hypothetical protein